MSELKEMAADAQRMAAATESALAAGVEAVASTAAAERVAAAEARAEAEDAKASSPRVAPCLVYPPPRSFSLLRLSARGVAPDVAQSLSLCHP